MGQEPDVSTAHAVCPSGIVCLVMTAIIAGLYGSIFGPYYVSVLGIILLFIAFGLARSQRFSSSRVLLLLGSGAILGALIYVVIGLIG